MARVPIPKNTFAPHPEGQHRGSVVEVEFKPAVETRFGPKDKLVLKIESKTAFMEDGEHAGEPFCIWIWDNISNDARSNLRQHREAILGRSLTPTEIESPDFDPEEEMKGVPLIYQVKHNPGTEPGVVYANIVSIMRDDGALAPAAQGERVLTPDMVEQITNWEVQLIQDGKISQEDVKAVRTKYLGQADLSKAKLDTGIIYYNMLKTQTGDDGLPF